MAANPKIIVNEISNFEILRMSEKHLDVVMKNEAVSYNFPWTRGIFLDCLKAGYQCWIGCFGNDVIGHVIFSLIASEAHLLNLCISPGVQGQGFGRLLATFAVERAKAADVGAMFLEVRSSNIPAISLYESIGFSEVGMRKNYYPARIGYEDALVLALDIKRYGSFDRV
tara:strand:- start:785 stop:1291 length:507 start_codon:yes stop_codon:yes gene_type:complete